MPVPHIFSICRALRVQLVICHPVDKDEYLDCIVLLSYNLTSGHLLRVWSLFVIIRECLEQSHSILLSAVLLKVHDKRNI